MKKIEDLNKIKEGNILIHCYMGYELMTDMEKVISNGSERYLERNNCSAEDFCKRIGNLPDLKLKGSVISKLDHHNVFYSDHLRYYRSLDALLPVLVKLKKEYYKYEHLTFVMNNLLEDERLKFSVENLQKQIVKLIKQEKLV